VPAQYNRVALGCHYKRGSKVGETM